MNIETTINFGGFYESIHSGNIDSMIECQIEHADLIDQKEFVNDRTERVHYPESKDIFSHAQ